MSGEELPSLDPDASPEEQKELIKQASEQKYQEQQAQHAAMLEAVAQGENGISVEKYEWVELGNVDAKVKAWMPGEAMDSITKASRLSQRESLHDATESFHTMVEGMTQVTEVLKYQSVETTDQKEIREFWVGMYDEWGVNGFQEAAGIVLEPATNDREEKEAAVDSFPENESG